MSFVIGTGQIEVSANLKINKTDKPLARLSKNKRERTQINKTMNVRRQITTNTAKIQTIIREYYKQLNVNKLGNMEEMQAFLETYKLPKLKQGEIENLNRSITSKEIESITNQRNWMASWGNSTKHLKKN